MLQRAVEALSDRSPEMRHAVYDRARTALLEQLRGLDPPLSGEDIARERRALDEAIGRIEAGYAPAAPAPRPAPAAPAPARAPEPPTPPRPRVVERAPDPRLDLPEASPPGAGRGAPAFTVPERRKPPAFDDLAKPASAEAGEGATRERPRIDAAPPRRAGEGRMRSVVLGLVLLTVIGAIAVAAWLLREDPAAVAEAPPVVEAPASAQPSAGKAADRLGGDRPASPPAAPAAPAAPRNDTVAVAQRAVLYEENPADPRTPRAMAGRAVWRLDAINAGQGQPLETAVRATVEVAEAGLTLNLVMRRNLDTTLPASHTVELSFATGGDSARVVRDLGLPQLKNEENTPGAALDGLPVPVKDNLFLIGLSSVPGSADRNRELILRRNWIDMPMRFASGRRAILSFEKGVSGDQILAEAFRQWNEAAGR
ncbi:MAG TPA: histidine kinase [Salinarimonas sp.]|nr:histidine kinase [Salinarimonas sp.]